MFPSRSSHVLAHRHQKPATPILDQTRLMFRWRVPTAQGSNHDPSLITNHRSDSASCDWVTCGCTSRRWCLGLRCQSPQSASCVPAGSTCSTISLELRTRSAVGFAEMVCDCSGFPLPLSLSFIRSTMPHIHRCWTVRIFLESSTTEVAANHATVQESLSAMSIV